ncbi:MAG: hypothetical protein CM15mP21_3310 [Hyphomicrobiales bacterium]|nr:MAG: hypothetical protein CM15mP21_3310 [Hyphomicrobiales bacterium]
MLPEMMFVVDTNKESIAIAEARHWVFRWLPFWTAIATQTVLIIRYRAMMMARAIELYCDLISKAAIAGIEEGNISAGVDLARPKSRASRLCLRRLEAPAEAAVEAVSGKTSR